MDTVTFTCFGCFTESTVPTPALGATLTCPNCGIAVVSDASQAGEAEGAIDIGLSDAERKALIVQHATE